MRFAKKQTKKLKNNFMDHYVKKSDLVVHSLDEAPFLRTIIKNLSTY
jgi:hypothetical protein